MVVGMIRFFALLCSTQNDTKEHPNKQEITHE